MHPLLLLRVLKTNTLLMEGHVLLSLVHLLDPMSIARLSKKLPPPIVQFLKMDFLYHPMLSLLVNRVNILLMVVLALQLLELLRSLTARLLQLQLLLFVLLVNQDMWPKLTVLVPSPALLIVMSAQLLQMLPHLKHKLVPNLKLDSIWTTQMPPIPIGL